MHLHEYTEQWYPRHFCHFGAHGFQGPLLLRTVNPIPRKVVMLMNHLGLYCLYSGANLSAPDVV